MVNLPVYRWMRKHGVENISAATISIHSTVEAANFAEIQAIETEGTHVSVGGLNVTRGGDGSLGHVHSPEIIEKIRLAATGRKRSPESIAKAMAARVGYTPTPETRAKMSAAGRRRVRTPEEAANHLANAARGDSNGMTKLTEGDVVDIKARLLVHESQRAIAARFGVAQTAVSAIARGLAWRHVPWPGGRRPEARTPSEIRAALSNDTVLEIRRLKAEEGLGGILIARRLGLSRGQVARILDGSRYQHVA